MKRVLQALTFALLATAPPPLARADEHSHPLVIDVPALDAPRAGDLDGRFPTWSQTSALAVGFVDVAYGGIHSAPRGLGRARVPVEMAGAVLFTLLFYGALPGSPGWAHEEAHRAVLARRGLDSTNELNHPGRDPVSDDGNLRVYGVTDEELAAFKADDPAGFVRMHSAGLEEQIHIGREVEKDVFFAREARYTYAPFHLWNKFRAFYYLHRCTSVSAEDIESEEELPELHRDFTGPDCTAWAYDLNRPDEPYGGRGAYADGTVRRARAPST